MKAISRLSVVTLLVGSTAVVAAVVGVGNAAAFSVSNVASVGGGSNQLLVAGTVGQPIGGLTLEFTDNAVSHGWSAGDTITVQLWDATANAPLSNTSLNAFRSASFTGLPVVSSTNSIGTTYYSVALAKGATSSVNDEFVLTFKKDAPLDTKTTTFSFSGLNVSLGSRIPAGHPIQLKVTANNGTPFAGAANTATVGIGIIPAMSLTVSGRTTGAPGTVGLSFGSLTVRDTAGGAVNIGDEINLTLTGGFFSNAGTASGDLPASTTPSVVTVNNASDTLKVTAKKTSTVGDTLTVSGAKIVLPASAGEVYLVAKDKTTSMVLGAVGVASVVKQTRIGGVDRYATACQLFDLHFSGASSVVLASGTNYPDALSAIYLAGQLSTGVLTTDPNSLSTATKTELLTRAIKTVYIVGGSKAVSDVVASQISAMHVGNNASAPLINVVRVAGPDRYETNRLVDTRAPAGATTAVVATGENFADALAVGPAVYRAAYPLVLTASKSLSPSALSTINALGIKHVIIVGGTSAVSSAVETALGQAGVNVDYRIAGVDRTDTAAQVAAWETDGLAGHDMYPALGSVGFSGTGTINAARGDNFADALAAGAVAGFEQSVIVLTTNPTTVGAGIPTYFAGRAGQTSTLRALGQTSALSATTMNAAAIALTQPLNLS